MMNFKQADLTTPNQKIGAGLLVVVVLFVLYIITPPLVILFKNLVLLAIYGSITVFLVLNYENIWMLAKKLTWEITKGIISTDPVWALRRGHEYVISKLDELSSHIKAVSAIKSMTENQVVALIKENENLARLYEKVTDAEKIIYQSKIGSNKNLIDKLTPKIDFASKQKDEMSKIHESWRINATIMENEIESLAKEYEIVKELNKATNAAQVFMKQSPEMEKFKEAKRQTEKKIYEYTSNIEAFHRDVIPSLTLSSSNNALLQEDGLKIIEEYRTKTFA